MLMAERLRLSLLGVPFGPHLHEIAVRALVCVQYTRLYLVYVGGDAVEKVTVVSYHEYGFAAFAQILSNH